MALSETETNAPAERIDRDLVLVRAAPMNAETPAHAVRLDITPTEHHYVRTNFPIPAHDGTLVIAGEVANPLTLKLDDLRKFQVTTLAVSLECAGNGRIGMLPLPEGEPWASHAVGTAYWTGVHLADVLAQAEPLADGVDVSFAGADEGVYKGRPDIRFVRALPLDYVLESANDVLIAFEMNGEPLNANHGAPLRLIVPGWYGMASVKWLSRIEVRTTPYVGQFQTSSYVFHWSDRDPEPVTTMRVRALITDPLPGTEPPRGTHLIRGKAWSGAAPIASVEISTVAGEWLPAELEPPVGPYAWQSWSFNWEAPAVGRYVLRARATDAAGNTQPDVAEWNRLGYGNNAIQPFMIEVTS